MRISDWSSDVCSSDLADGAVSFQIRGARFQRQPVWLLQAEFGGVLDRQHAFAGVDHFGQRVEHGGLARSGAARNDDVEAAGARNFQRVAHLLAIGSASVWERVVKYWLS